MLRSIFFSSSSHSFASSSWIFAMHHGTDILLLRSTGSARCPSFWTVERSSLSTMSSRISVWELGIAFSCASLSIAKARGVLAGGAGSNSRTCVGLPWSVTTILTVTCVIGSASFAIFLANSRSVSSVFMESASPSLSLRRSLIIVRA